MSGLIENIGNLFGGSSAKTDRKQQLAGYGDLSNVFNFGLNQGKRQEGTGSDLQGQAGAYYSKLLSGDRSATMSAVAPTVNAVNTQTDATKRGIAQSGTARGGGVNATTQTLEDKRRAGIDTAVNEAKSGAAEGAARVGSSMTADAARLLGLGERSAESLTDESRMSRPVSDQLHRQTAHDAGQFGNQIADIIATIFMGGSGGGAGASG